MKHLLLLLLIVDSSCKVSRQPEVNPQDSRSTSLVLDSLDLRNPNTLDTIRVSPEGWKSLFFGSKKVKLKRTTVIIQNGGNNVANATGKVKGPQAIVAGDDAKIGQVQEPKNSVITTGDNSPASQTQPSKKSNWYLFMALGAAVVIGLYLFWKTK